MKKLSIIVPTRNGIETLPNLLDGIRIQTLYTEAEIIIIDSESEDGTYEYLCKQKDVKIHRIQAKDFNHGATRNYGVSLANGEIIVMTVQDAKPSDSKWLENLVAPFNDSDVAGVCGHQIVPHTAETNPHEWSRPQSKPNIKTYQFKNDEFEKLGASNQQQYCGWDDVIAAYRKSVLLELPFQAVMFGEDMIWAKDALTKGLKIAYTPYAQVEHYHHHFSEFTYKRALVVSLFKYNTFGTIETKVNCLKELLQIVYRNFRWKLPLKWIPHNCSYIIAKNKAINEFRTVIKENRLDKLAQTLNLDIPIGHSKTPVKQ